MRVLLAIFLPPLAVLDKGCGSVVLVTVLTIFGWIPGILAALIIASKSKPIPVVIYAPSPQTQNQPKAINTPKPPKKYITLEERLRQMENFVQNTNEKIDKIIDSVRRMFNF